MDTEVEDNVVKLAVVESDPADRWTAEAKAAIDDAVERARELNEERKEVLDQVKNWQSFIIVGYDEVGVLRTAAANNPCLAHAHWALSRAAHSLLAHIESVDPVDDPEGA